jgi:hypothetical protein
MRVTSARILADSYLTLTVSVIELTRIPPRPLLRFLGRPIVVAGEEDDAWKTKTTNEEFADALGLGFGVRVGCKEFADEMGLGCGVCRLQKAHQR